MGDSRLKLDVFLVMLAKYFRRGGIPVRWIVPDLNGDLIMNIAMKGGEQSFRWASGDGEIDAGAPLMDRAFIAPQDFPQSAARALAERLNTMLSGIGGPARAILDRRNRNIDRVPRCAEGVRKLVANLISKDRPAWGGYALNSQTNVMQDGHERFLFEFLDDDQRVTMAFCPDEDDPLRERAFCITAIGALALIDDTRSEDQKSLLAHQIERLLAYQFQTGAHASMSWGEAIPEPVEAIDESQDRHDRRDDDGRRTRDEGPRLIDSLSESPDLWDDTHDDAFFQRWGHDDWFYLSLFFSPGVDYVCHGGRECPGGSPIFVDPTERRVPAPWRLRFLPRQLKRMTLSGVDDRSTIFGGESHLNAILKQRATDPGELAILTSHCEYSYIGDRVSEIAAAHPLAKNNRLYYAQTPMPQFLSTSQDLNWWKGIIERLGSPVDKPNEAQINLIGIAPANDARLHELEALLGACGISVGMRLYPLVEPQHMERFANSQTSIARPWRPIARVITDLIKERGFSVSEPPAPYGIEGTKRWLDAICDAVGRPHIDGESWQAALAPYHSYIERYLARMRETPIAFVVREDALEELFKPQFFYGFDLSAWLIEIGTPLHMILIGSAEPDETGDSVLLSKLPDTSISHVASLEDALEHLSSCGARLVYSDVEDNRHARQAGLATFGIFDIEPGIHGHLGTLRRLVCAADSGFSRRYRRYLTSESNSAKRGRHG